MPVDHPMRVIIDSDMGVDDALAILLALRSPELDVVAITTVCGNVPVGQATKNLARMLDLAGIPSGVLIGQGAARPLELPLMDATVVHGADGLGELDRFHHPDGRPRYPGGRMPEQLRTAQDVWSECVRRYPDNVTLVTLGPLTNLAIALKVDTMIPRQMRRIVSMGGAAGVPGNVSPVAEFNIYVDPHAARRVFQSGLPLTLIPLDVTTRVGLTREEISVLTRDSGDPCCRFLSDATGKPLEFAEKVEGHGVFYLHDPLTVAVASDETLVSLNPCHADVETEGKLTKGMTVVDRRTLEPSHKSSPNMRIALDVQRERFLALFRDRLCPASS